VIHTRNDENMNIPIMKCGHAANSLGKRTGETESCPACVICDCFELADPQPVLDGRRARCNYYGHAIGRRGDCDYPKNVRPKDNICHCEADSAYNLPFFKRNPDKEFDEFYCGCACGWD
jgi:hypothetical protein